MKSLFLNFILTVENPRNFFYSVMDKNTIYHHRKETRDIALCKQCAKRIKTPGGSTNDLKQVVYMAIKRVNIKLMGLNEMVKSSQRTCSCYSINNYFFFQEYDESLDAVLLRIITKDGIPLNKFCTSKDLNKEIPKSPKIIQKQVMDYAEKKLRKMF